MAEEVKVIIGADTKQLTSELDKANTSIKNFGSAVQNSSSRAMQSLNDVSRIVQDLPYGFIGISNNINPLVESFARLKQETKDTGGPLEALKAALSGPAGVGLAFGVVSAAISFSVTGLSRWVKSSKNTEDAASSFNETFARSKQIIDDVKDSFDSLTYSQDTALQLWGAFTDIQFGKGTTESVLTRSRQEYVVLADKLQGAKDNLVELGDVLSKTRKEFYKFEQSQIPSISLWGQQDGAVSDFDFKLKQLVRRFGSFEKINPSAIIGFTEEQKFAIESVLAAQKAYTEKQIEIQKLDDELALKAVANRGLVIEQNKKEQNSLKKTGETIDEILAKFRRKLTAEEALGLPKLEEVRAKINDYEAVIQKLIVDKKVKLTFPKLIELQQELKGLRDLENELDKKPLKIKIEPIGPQLDKEFSKLNEVLQKFRQGLKAEELKLLPPEDVTKNQINDYRALIEKLIKDFNFSENSVLIKKLQDELSALLGKSINGAKIDTKSIDVLVNATADVFALIGTSIGNAIAGQGDTIKNAFDGLFMIFGDALITLGKYAILQSELMLKLKAAIAAGSFTAGVASGIALIALGTLIKTTLSGINSKAGFATGTNFAPGGMALVGERGPELVSLPQGSKVIPNGRTNAMMQGAFQAVEVYGTLKGQDIYFSNKKYGLTYNRQT